MKLFLEKEMSKMEKTKEKVMSVKTRLLVILIPCIAVAIASLIVVFYIFVAKQMKSMSEDMLESSVQSQEKQIEAWLSEKLSAFQMVKRDIEGETRTDEELQEMLGLYVGYEADYPDGLYIADSKGNLLTGAGSGKQIRIRLLLYGIRRD